MSFGRISSAKGYTAELNFLANFDGASRHFDKNGFITRPAPIGNVRRSLRASLLPRLDR